MLLSNSFTKAIGIELSRLLAGLYCVLDSSNRRNELFVFTIYIVTVLMIFSASRIVQVLGSRTRGGEPPQGKRIPSGSEP